MANREQTKMQQEEDEAYFSAKPDPICRIQLVESSIGTPVSHYMASRDEFKWQRQDQTMGDLQYKASTTKGKNVDANVFRDETMGLAMGAVTENNQDATS